MKKTLRITALGFTALFVFQSTLFADDSSMTRRLFEQIGSMVTVVVMPLILLVSLAMVYFVLEGFFLLRRTLLLPPDLINNVHGSIRNGRIKEALEHCRSDNSLFARMVRAGLGKMKWGHSAMVKGMEDAGQEMSVGLFHRIGNLSLIASIAPMLGLLGTVTGMIQAFNKIVEIDTHVTPGHVADGIRVALNTTAAGLLVAIPALICFNYLRDHLVRIVLEAQAIGEEILLPFKETDAHGGPTPPAEKVEPEPVGNPDEKITRLTNIGRRDRS